MFCISLFVIMLCRSFQSRLPSLISGYLCRLQANSPDWVPLLLFGCLSIAAGLFALLLPDTLQQPPPNSTRPSDAEQQSHTEQEARYQAVDTQRHLPSDGQRHLQPTPREVTPSAIPASAEHTDGLTSPSAAERSATRQGSSIVRESETVRQVRATQTYHVVPSIRTRLQHQQSEHLPRASVATSSTCSCSCYSPAGGAAPVLLTGENVTMMPRYGSTANTLYSYGQYCPYCINSLRRNGAVPGGELSGAVGTQRRRNFQSRGGESHGEAAAVSYDVPPRTRRVPWWKRGTDMRGMIERCIVDGRIVTITRGGGVNGSFTSPEPQREDVSARARDSISPSRSPVGPNEAETSSALPVGGQQTVETRGMFSRPSHEFQPDDIRERNSRPGPFLRGKIARRVVLEARGRVGERGRVESDGNSDGNRTGNVTVQRPGDRPGGIVRLVVARVGA